MIIPYWFSDFTRGLDPKSDEWLDSALSDADAEARIIAAELVSPNDADYGAMVEKYYDELCDWLYASAL
ncbi:MAG: hypothetical protein WAR79_16615 [Melioribacteraceae bacterium]